MIIYVSVGGTKQKGHGFQDIASSWFIMCTFSFCFSELFSPLLPYAGPAPGSSAYAFCNLLVGDCIQTCGYNCLLYFDISK